MYAKIIDGTVSTLGTYPHVEWGDGRWWDLRDADTRAARGWFEVQFTDRPDDTDTTTHDVSYEVVDGLPVQTWTPRPWTPEEVTRRAENAARLDDLEERVGLLEDAVFPPPPDTTNPDDPTVPTWAETGGVWPAGGLLRDGGTVWRNVSTVPLTTPPSGFPGTTSQWSHLFVVVAAPEPDPEPDPTPAWSGAGISYLVGMEVTYNGRRYRVVQAHTSQPGWTPTAVPALWTDLGPV